MREMRQERGARVNRSAAALTSPPDAAGAAAGAAVAPSVSRVGYAPITRVDATRREIELCATSEALDSFGTIFDYEASRDAFTRWIGNIREMHERRAVGSSVAVRCDDEARRVYVRARISHGAQDTWEKVIDGTLRGASIGATNVIWRRERRVIGGRGRMVNVATRYDLAELSLVDNPSNPDALGVAIVRDAEPNLAVLAEAEPAERAAAAIDSLDADVTGDGSGKDAAPPPTDSAGEIQATLHSIAQVVLAGCGCPLCELALVALNAEPDSDPDASADVTQPSSRVMAAMTAALRASASSIARLGRLESSPRAREKPLSPQESGWGAVGAGRGAIGAIRAADDEIAALRTRIARLESQPMPGGPVAHAIEKPLAAQERGWGEVGMGAASPLTALEALAGRLRDPQAQMAVAAEIIRLQQDSRP